MDLRANTYQDRARLLNRINAYVSKLQNFKGASWGGHTIRGSEITQRTLNLIVPKGTMTAAQKAAIDAAGSRAEQVGVKLNIIHD
jgi:hypothetical protein